MKGKGGASAGTAGEGPQPIAAKVDARGHRCPTPTLRLRRALARVAPGELVSVLADDPLARIDIPHFAATNGHHVLSLTQDQHGLRVVVRKAQPTSGA